MKDEGTLRKPDRESLRWEPPGDLEVREHVLDDFPYPHVDVWAYDDEGEKYVFGVGRDPEEGMKFYHVTGDGAEPMDRPDHEGENPVCPFHQEETVPTKQFDFPGVDRVQFKCPTCYLTRYRDDKVII